MSALCIVGEWFPIRSCITEDQFTTLVNLSLYPTKGHTTSPRFSFDTAIRTRL